MQAAIERLHRRNQLARITAGGQADEPTDVFERTIGSGLARIMTQLGLRLDTLEPNLRLVGRSLEQHLAQKVLLAIFGLALPMLLGVLWNVVGLGVSLTLPLVGGLLLGVIFFFAPDLVLRSEANDRRKDFRHSLGSFLDLVVISLAGGAGVESALRDAANIGRGWAYGQVRRALEVTALTGETPWAALARLGEEVGVPELVELSASISLAGTEGARVRDSLAVKAMSLREHALAEAQGDAEASTEKMAVPTVLLFAGFLILIGYPAVDAVITGL
ncbi:MAG: type II secretion system F family protein [Acidimicrobiales bacterium]